MTRSGAAAALTFLAVVFTQAPPSLAQELGSDATLSALVVGGRSVPGFSSDTTVYAMSFGYTVERVTIRPTKSHASATVAYFDADDLSLVDAVPGDGHQVDLAVGDTIVKVQVTAQDTMTVRTYTVTVTRTEEDTSLSPPASDSAAPFPSDAVYTVTFEGTWTAAVTPAGIRPRSVTPPDGLPGNAHFSRLIGAVHGSAVTFLESGEPASAGVESMAEVGKTVLLKSEVQAAIDADPPSALSVIEGHHPARGPHETETLGGVQLTTAFPRVTLMRMIAPTHDWFVGVSGLPLLDSQGHWLREHQVDLYAWDAGTEEGTDFALDPSIDTVPRGDITSIRGTGPFSTRRIATLAFELQSVGATLDLPEGGEVGTDLGAPLAAVSTTGTVTYTLGGADAGLFALDSLTGQLRTDAELDTGPRGSFEVTVTVTDDAGSIDIAVTVDANDAPEFGSSTAAREVREDAAAGAAVGDAVTATDPDDDDEGKLTYELAGSDVDSFTIDAATGQIRVGADAVLDFESGRSYSVVVTARDPSQASASTTVTITVADVDEPPIAGDDSATMDEDTPVTIDVLANDSDPEGANLEASLQRPIGAASWTLPQAGTVALQANGDLTYTPDDDFNGLDGFHYAVSDGSNWATARVSVQVRPVNDAPVFPDVATERTVVESAQERDAVGRPVAAMDVDGDELSYSLTGSTHFDIEAVTVEGRDAGQIVVAPGAVLDAETEPTHVVTVTARDGDGETATLEVTITVSAPPVTPSLGSAAVISGGGGPSGPSPSTVDFEWTVTHDIDELDSGHDTPSGAWSNGATLWLLENGSGADDAIYAYNLDTGERVGDRELELDETNRAPRGVWSDRTVIWISDSGQEKLFAYDLESGERLPARDLVLAARNRDARGIWSDGTTMWVLDGGKHSLFAYDLESGALLGECELDGANSDPRGVWSDRFTVWVSNHDPKRLFAYRLPTREELDAAGEDKALERVQDEEFTELSTAGNNSPRGIWSDGAVMYVADENDDKVYTYNVPDAIDARLVSLTLSRVDIGEFDPARREYEGVPDNGVTSTTVEAQALQPGATVAIEPGDADEDAEGHQVELASIEEIVITVTSPDGGRERTYRVHLGEAAEAGPSGSCLRGAVSVGFSLVLFEGGSLEGLVACAQGRHVSALYALHEGEYVSYIVGAPEFVTARFRGLFADGVPALLPLVVRSEGPATPAPAAPAVTEPFATCLSGEIGEGFSLVVYEGGSVADLDSCAAGFGVTAVYALVEGEYVPYFVGAPEFVTARFRTLFPDGVPAATPLTVRGAGPPGLDGGDGDGTDNQS